MRRSRNLLIGCLAVLGVFLAERAVGRTRRPTTTPNETPAPASSNERRIQVAVLLDVSGSMSGLIAQTRTELWRLVSELSKARAGEQRPRLEMALYTYGRSDSPERGFIRQMTPFTNDMDRFSEALFAEQPAGGDEFCGEAIKDATQQLEWSSNPDDMKLIFIAGNESFRQGTVDPMAAINQAVRKGITINTVHCGDQQVGINDGWQQGAMVASGKYMFINHNQAVAQVATPQDAELVRLNEELGQKYIPYGAPGATRLQRRNVQDNNAATLSLSSAATRASYKANLDICDGMDNDCDGSVQTELVNVATRNPSKLAAMAEADLPAELRGKTLEEKKAWVAQRKQERDRLQERIRQLSTDRQQYIAAHQGTGQNTMGQAMIDAVHEQASRAHLTFAETKQAP